MEKSPIFDKLKDKVNSLKDGISPVDGEYTQTEQDVLEQFRIPQSIEIPEEIMTTAEVDKIRFPKSKPVGLHPQSVEEFHRQTKASIKFYLSKLEKRDRDVHKLATEVDKYKTDFMNTKYQLELFQGAGGQAIVGSDGEYLTESSLSDNEKILIEKDNEIVSLQNKLTMLQADLSREQANRGNSGGSSLTDAELVELENYRENETQLGIWEAQVKDSYSALEDENQRIINEMEVLRQSLNGSDQTEQISELINAKNELEAYVDQAVLTNESLNSSIDTLEKEKIQLVNSNEQLVSENEKLLNEKNQLVSTIQEKEKNVSSLENEIETTNQRLSELENNDKTEIVEKLQTEMLTLTEEYNQAVDVANEIEEARKELEEARKELEETVQSLTNELAEANEKLNSANSTPDNSTSEEITAHIEQLDEHIDMLEKLIEERDAQIISQNQDIEKQNQDIEKLVEEIDALKSSTKMGNYVVDGYILPDGVTPEDLGI